MEGEEGMKTLLMNQGPFCIALVIGYFFLRFGMVSLGYLRLYIQVIGGLTLTATLIASFIILGWKSGLITIVLFCFVVTPLTEIPIRWIQAKIHASY